MKKTILSGIQPSGTLLIGHYTGAIKQWVALQDECDCYYSIVDLHAITVEQNPKTFADNCYDILALYLACGIDPNKSTIFLQSHVPAHTQLMWILNCFTSMGELSRMTQFKDKSKQHSQNINVGLFAYPVLQAADILLYNANLVPIGADQKQHLELCRNIAIRFNNKYGNTFTVPEPFIPKFGARIMSLQNPTKKMSKSDQNSNNYIALLDDPDTIMKKMKRAVTDSDTKIYFDQETKPGVSNLLQLFALTTNASIEKAEQTFQKEGYSTLKTKVADAIIEFLEPIQKEYKKLRIEINHLNEILVKGKEKAITKTEKTLNSAKNALGLLN